MYILDTDFIIALYFPLESTHKRAVVLAEKYLTNQESILTDPVLFELATVISRKYSQTQAIQALETLKKAPNGTLALSKEDVTNTWKLFGQQKKRGTSVVDCSNIVIARKLKCNIISFDAFYKDFNLLVDR